MPSRETHILYTAFILATTLAMLHFLAMIHYLYWSLWWYDVMMHFLAGFVLGLTGYWLLFKSGLFFTSLYKPVFMILTLFIAVFILGAAWEVFEYTNGMTNSHEGYKVDVLNDLTLDSAGTVLAVLLATRKRKVNV